MNQFREVERRKFINWKRFRFSFITVIIITFILLLIIGEVIIYFLIRSFAFSLPTVDLQISVLRFGFWCMFALLIFCILAGIIVIFVSLNFIHRALGPIPRLEREVDEMLRTGEYKPLETRRTDFLRELISRINLLIHILFSEKRKDEK